MPSAASRREFLRSTAAAAVLPAVGGVLAACQKTKSLSDDAAQAPAGVAPAADANLHDSTGQKPGPTADPLAAANAMDAAHEKGVKAFPAKTAQELIAHVRANPGAVNFASQGNGSTSHLSAMLFQKLTGTEMRHVPYRGTTPALQDLMGNHVDLFFDNHASSLPLHRSGKATILAVAAPERSKLLPEVPTLREAGLRDFSSSTWFAIVAPPLGSPMPQSTTESCTCSRPSDAA